MFGLELKNVIFFLFSYFKAQMTIVKLFCQALLKLKVKQFVKNPCKAKKHSNSFIVKRIKTLFSDSYSV